MACLSFWSKTDTVSKCVLPWQQILPCQPWFACKWEKRPATDPLQPYLSFAKSGSTHHVWVRDEIIGHQRQTRKRNVHLHVSLSHTAHTVIYCFTTSQSSASFWKCIPLTQYHENISTKLQWLTLCNCTEIKIKCRTIHLPFHFSNSGCRGLPWVCVCACVCVTQDLNWAHMPCKPSYTTANGYWAGRWIKVHNAHSIPFSHLCSLFSFHREKFNFGADKTKQILEDLASICDHVMLTVFIFEMCNRQPWVMFIYDKYICLIFIVNKIIELNWIEFMSVSAVRN